MANRRPKKMLLCYRPDEPSPILVVGERDGIDIADAHDQRAVHDTLAELVAFRPLGVHLPRQSLSPYSPFPS